VSRTRAVRSGPIERDSICARHKLGYPVVALLALLFAVLVGPDATFVAASVLAMLLLARSDMERAAAIGLPIVARLALAVGFFHFAPPDQVIDLAARDVSVFGLLIQNDIWWPRYLFTYPAVAAMDVWGLRFDYSFGLYCAAILPFEVLALYRAAEAALKGLVWKGHISRVPLILVLATLIFGLGSLMNGRLIPAQIGLAILLCAQTTAARRRRLGADTWGLTSLGLTMSQMSSGTGVVAYAQVLCGLLVVAVVTRRAVWSVVGGLVLLSGIVGPFLLRSVEKNVTFFGGGLDAIPGLLHHGLGGFLLDRPALLFVAIVGFVVALVGFRAVLWPRLFRRLPPTYLPAIIAIPLALGGGLFGYSTLTMIFPPVFLLTTIAFGRLITRMSHTMSRESTI
jgi:hypothetical protein